MNNQEKQIFSNSEIYVEDLNTYILSIFSDDENQMSDGANDNSIENSFLNETKLIISESEITEPIDIYLADSNQLEENTVEITYDDFVEKYLDLKDINQDITSNQPNTIEPNFFYLRQVNYSVISTLDGEKELDEPKSVKLSNLLIYPVTTLTALTDLTLSLSKNNILNSYKILKFLRKISELMTVSLSEQDAKVFLALSILSQQNKPLNLESLKEFINIPQSNLESSLINLHKLSCIEYYYGKITLIETINIKYK